MKAGNKISIILLSISVFLIFQAASYRTLNANENEPSWGLGISSGLLQSVSGSLDMDNSSADVLETGPSFGLTLSKRAGNRFRTEITAGMGWMQFGRDLYESSSNFSMAALILSNSYSVIRTGRLELHLRAGAGMYYWRISAEEVFGGARQFEMEDLQKVSIGLQGGLGASLSLNRRVSLTAESNYNYILCKDTFHFGRGFTEQGIIDIRLGLRFYL
ncbi:MAG: hypothetical protein GF417_11580 [Candidatus Latescibacteria bacterium]|nr:hypothetical protein [bacterium]MBD3425065.1 hypothetical protein [Candidatus Latescibacterota bacterium]